MYAISVTPTNGFSIQYTVLDCGQVLGFLMQRILDIFSVLEKNTPIPQKLE